MKKTAKKMKTDDASKLLREFSKTYREEASKAYSNSLATTGKIVNKLFGPEKTKEPGR